MKFSMVFVEYSNQYFWRVCREINYNQGGTRADATYEFAIH